MSSALRILKDMKSKAAGKGRGGALLQ